MSVKDLYLGVLTFGNASGYDLKKFFLQSFGHFYAAGYGPIHPALAELTSRVWWAAYTSAAPRRTASSIALSSRTT